jgi:hypothetical protein
LKIERANARIVQLLIATAAQFEPESPARSMSYTKAR